MIFPTMLAPHRTTNRGQPSIYFPIGDHVNVFWCRSHTNASGVIATSHIVASHITKLLLSFRQILQFRFPQGRAPRIKWLKQSHFCRCAMAILPPPKRPLCCEAPTKKLTFYTASVLLLLNVPLSLFREAILRRQKIPKGGTVPK